MDTNVNQLSDRFPAHTETDFLHDDGDTDMGADFLDLAQPHREIAVAFRHDHFLRCIDVDLQSIGFQNIDGALGIFERMVGADIREYLSVRIYLADDRKAVAYAGILQGCADGPGSHRQAGHFCDRGQIGIDLFCPFAAAGHAVDVEGRSQAHTGHLGLKGDIRHFQIGHRVMNEAHLPEIGKIG